MSKSGDRREKLIARLQLLGEQESTETAMFHQAAAASYGLGITDMKALQIVLREGPQTAGQLAIAAASYHGRGDQRLGSPGTSVVDHS